MVGHTHEDIDQSFSCLSRFLRKHDALTIPGIYKIDVYDVEVLLSAPKFVLLLEMEASCKASNQAVRGTEVFQYMFDIKSWISPFLEDIHGHTVPHIFCSTEILLGNV